MVVLLPHAIGQLPVLLQATFDDADATVICAKQKSRTCTLPVPKTPPPCAGKQLANC